MSHELRPHWQHAIRELATVILGVLIALAVNNWSIHRSESKLEIQYLQRIAEDLRRDSTFAATNLLPSVTRKREALAAIAPYVRGESASIADTLSFLKLLGNAGSMGVANASWARRTTFNELNATGNLRLIENPGVRSKIVLYYSESQIIENRVDARRSHYALTVHELMPAEMRDSLDMRSARRFKLGRLLARIRSEEFQDLMNQEINYALFVRLMVDSFHMQANELLGEVSKEIRRLQG